MKLSAFSPPVGPGEHPIRSALVQAIHDYENNRPRSTQKQMGPSEVGAECARQLAYKMLGERESHRSEKWPAIVGTALHTMMEYALKRVNDQAGKPIWIIEQRVMVRPGLSGSTDALHVPTLTVVDHKFVGKRSLEKYRKDGPSPKYRIQAHLYGKGWHNLGIPVRDVAIVFYPRTGASLAGTYIWTEPFDMAVADAALERLDSILAVAVDLDVEHHPENYVLIPKTISDDCRFCPFLRPGPDTGDACPGHLEEKPK